MDRKNDEIFSPIKNSDEEKKNSLSDSFSKFLEGPDAFRKSPNTRFEASVISKASGSKENKNLYCPTLSSHYKILSELHAVKSSVQSESAVTFEASGSKQNKRNRDPSSSSQHNLLSQGNVNEKTFSIKHISSKALQDKTIKSQSNCSLKNVKADNLLSGSTKENKVFSDTSLAAMYDKQMEDREGEDECKIGRKYTSNKLQLSSTKKSLQANAAIVSKATASKEIKNTKDSTLLNQYDSSSQMHSVESLKSEAVVPVASESKEIEKSHYFSTNQENPFSELESSVQSRTVFASEASVSKEIKKNHSQSTASQRNPLSQIQSRIEKIVSDAVESQVDSFQQLMWSHHCSLLKYLNETKETLENSHASERETLCKIMEELAEENRQLRIAACAHK